MLLHAARLTLRYQGRPLRVLLTRPAGQAEETAELVRQAGGEPLVFPCLRPGPPSDAQPLHAALALLRTQGFDGLALTSAHAVAQVLETLQQMPASELVVAAVGPRTAAALQQAGIAAVSCPEEGEESAMSSQGALRKRPAMGGLTSSTHSEAVSPPVEWAETTMWSWRFAAVRCATTWPIMGACPKSRSLPPCRSRCVTRATMT